MVAEVRLTGVEGFAQLSRALKDAGHGRLRKELTDRIAAGVKPVIPETRREAIARLPEEGGLNRLVAKAPQRVQTRTGPTTAGVRLVVGKNKSGARGANKGKIRHRAFGSDAFYPQNVTPGWFDDPAEAAKPRLVQAAEDAMQSIVDDIVRGAR